VEQGENPLFFDHVTNNSLGENNDGMARELLKVNICHLHRQQIFCDLTFFFPNPANGGYAVSNWHCYLLLPGLLLAIWVLHKCHAAKE
jgi:hypothetical protein